MVKAGVVRAFVASMFAITTAAAGLAVTASAAGAGPAPPPNCTVTVMPAERLEAAPQSEPRHCATLEVTKVVTGTPAPETTFTVGVDCAEVDVKSTTLPDASAADALPPGQTPPFTTTLTFPAQGGAQDVFLAAEGDCTVTETPSPGCTLTSIDPVETHIDRSVEFPVTVTNDCQSQAPEQAAVAVVVAPRFTG